MINKIKKRLQHLTEKSVLVTTALFDRLLDTAALYNLKIRATWNGLHVPLPQIGLERGNTHTAGKGNTSLNKMQLILTHLPLESTTAVDIGCHNGFFSLTLARLRSLHVYGYDPDPSLIRIASLVAYHLKIRTVAFCNWGIDLQNLSTLPQVDIMLVLSVFHNWVQSMSFQEACTLLQRVWTKTKQVMFFELPNTLENKKISEFMPAMGATIQECERYIEQLLKQLPNSRVSLIAFLPTDFRPNESRHLFKVERI